MKKIVVLDGYAMNPGVEHETVDGAIHQAEVAALNVQGVPSVFADGELLHT